VASVVPTPASTLTAALSSRGWRIRRPGEGGRADSAATTEGAQPAIKTHVAWLLQQPCIQREMRQLLALAALPPPSGAVAHCMGIMHLSCGCHASANSLSKQTPPMLPLNTLMAPSQDRLLWTGVQPASHHDWPVKAVSAVRRQPWSGACPTDCTTALPLPHAVAPTYASQAMAYGGCADG
jgi:hypothetical protein